MAMRYGVGNGSLKGEWSGCEHYGEDGKKGENYDAEGYISRVCPKDDAHRNLITAWLIH